MAKNSGKIKESGGEVTIKNLPAFDMVANPGFSSARLKDVDEWMKDYNEVFNYNKHENPHPDIDPYGEEIWDDERSSPIEFGNLMPVVRKIATQTVGLDLVAVKPMKLPVGELFWFDYKYGNGDDENIETKGQVFSDIDPYGEENWED
jgi:hypothetical protein